MAYFSSFQQSFHAEDRPNKQSSTSQKKKNRVCSGFGDEGGAKAAFRRGESDMKVSPNGNINIRPGDGGPWFWGGGEMPMSPNRMRSPWFMGGCHMAVAPPVPPVPPVPPMFPASPCHNLGSGIGAPWTNWGRVDMETDSDGARKVPSDGKPLASPLAPQNLNKGPGAGASRTQGRVEVTMDSDGVKEVHANRRHRIAPPSENINIDAGYGAPLFWGEGEIKLPPDANVNIGLGAGGHNSGRMSASVNHHHGTINF
ncbi:hypothetical protein SLA2020_328420 [Shorea laevis]